MQSLSLLRMLELEVPPNSKIGLNTAMETPVQSMDL